MRTSGPQGNERLTTQVGLLLIILTAALGVTIIQIGRLIWFHLFIGLLLLGPVTLKLASTGYRFARYYIGDRVYRRKGPPPPVLRGLAPVVVLFTIGVYASGILLLVLGPDHRGRLLLIHKVTFVAWLGVTALHVIGHLPEISRFLRLRRSQELAELEGLITRVTRAPSDAHPTQPPRAIPGRNGRGVAIGSAVVLGLVLALVLLPDYGTWTSAMGAFQPH
jgi:hypothetical protein